MIRKKIDHIQFVLIFEFTLIYLLYVLFVLQVEDNLEREKVSPKGAIFVI